jgi:hypothetical protein
MCEGRSGGLSRRFFYRRKKWRAVRPRHAREEAENVCWYPQSAERTVERATAKLATSEAARPKASSSTLAIFIFCAIKISQIRANFIVDTESGNARIRETEKKMPIFRVTLLRPVISDTLTSFMVVGFWCNARTAVW